MRVAKERLPLSYGPSTREWNQAHEALKTDEQLWRFLRFDGLQPDGAGGLFEARTCPHCQSTLLRPISRERALALHKQLLQLQVQVHEALPLSRNSHSEPVHFFGEVAQP